MFALLWKYILSIFTIDKVGILVRLILMKSTITITSDILDPVNQKKAYEFVKELHQNNEMTGLEKAKIFNKKMLEWSLKEGRKLTTSAINCLREFAVAAIKTETAEAPAE